MSVKNFTPLPQMNGDTVIPVAAASEAAAAENLRTNPNQLAAWLETQGFARDVSDVPVRFIADVDLAPAGVADTLYVVTGNGRGLYTYEGSAYVAMYVPATEPGNTTASGITYVTLSGGGITVVVGYTGSTEPTLTGSAGTYNVTFQTGTGPASIDVEALDAEVNTASGNFTITAQAPRRYKATFLLEDLSSGRVFPSSPGLEVLRTSTGAGQDTLTFNGIESITSGFGINLKYL